MCVGGALYAGPISKLSAVDVHRLPKAHFHLDCVVGIDSTLPVVHTHTQTARSMVVVSASRKIIHIQTMAKQKHRKHASTKIHFICRHKYTRRKKSGANIFSFTVLSSSASVSLVHLEMTGIDCISLFRNARTERIPYECPYVNCL